MIQNGAARADETRAEKYSRQRTGFSESELILRKHEMLQSLDNVMTTVQSRWQKYQRKGEKRTRLEKHLFPT